MEPHSPAWQHADQLLDALRALKGTSSWARIDYLLDLLYGKSRDPAALAQLGQAFDALLEGWVLGDLEAELRR